MMRVVGWVGPKMMGLFEKVDRILCVIDEVDVRKSPFYARQGSQRSHCQSRPTRPNTGIRTGAISSLLLPRAGV